MHYLLFFYEPASVFAHIPLPMFAHIPSPVCTYGPIEHITIIKYFVIT